jgi:hypothetical protein
MTTSRQPSVHYRGAPTRQRIQDPLPRQAVQRGARPTLHLKLKKDVRDESSRLSGAG